MNLASALFSHYRRHPLQLAALASIILLATLLWTGVATLTAQARASLATSEQAVASQWQVLREDGAALTVADFVALRRQGVCVAPWLEVRRPPPEGRVIGIDPLAMGCFDDAALGDRATALDGAPFLDIGEAIRLAADGYDTEFYLLASGPAEPLPTGYALTTFALGPPTGELADSFLFNLDALGVLVLLITGLLVRSVYHLGLAQRRDSFALLHRFGVPPAQVRKLLAIELFLLSLICVLPGVWLGQMLASALGQGFGRALDGLFDVGMYAGGSGWPALRAMVIMIALVLAACLSDWLVPRRWRAGWGLWRGLWRDGRPKGATGLGQAAAAVLLSGLLMVYWAPGLLWTFGGIALVFAAVGWLTPMYLARGADGLAARAANPLARWRCRELAVICRRLALPVVALQFAVALVLAVQALVTTFENTFDGWLAQRLTADVYVDMPANARGGARAGMDFLASLEGIGDWHQVTRGRGELALSDGSKRPVDLYAITPITPLVSEWPLLDSVPDPWRALQSGGVMINEQLARRQDWLVGDQVALLLSEEMGEDTGAEMADEDAKPRPVVAIYADYGRPSGEVLLPGDELLPGDGAGDGYGEGAGSWYPRASISFSINTGNLPVATIRQGLERVWEVGNLTVRDNVSVRRLATNIFAQTFLLTRAITLLTLILTTCALLVMGWVFFSSRIGYFRLLTIWGLPRRQVTRQLRRLSVAVTLLVGIAAMPLGIWLTWVLVSRINPLAFGWSLPMAIYPGFWLELGLLCGGIGLVIAALMQRQLRHAPPEPVAATLVEGGER